MLSVGSLDIFEIHSTGMEALSTGWYEDIYGEDADLARIRFLDSALYTVFSGCLFDEFQRVVYADPTLTPEQISQTFVTLAALITACDPSARSFRTTGCRSTTTSSRPSTISATP